MEIAMTYIDIPLDKLFVSPLNARKDLAAGQEDASLEELASSIRQQGLLSPLIVRSAPDDRYEVLAGQRRLLACRKTGLDQIPCILREDLDETDAMTLSLAENVHRADMHPLDKARALKALYDHHGSFERAARIAALSPPHSAHVRSTPEPAPRASATPGDGQRLHGRPDVGAPRIHVFR